MISCSNYDYIEIACMYKYPVEITLESGHHVVGKAIDTARNQQSEECIKVKNEYGDLLVVLDSISRLKVTIDNPHFDEVLFD
ncbi:transcriptional regulator [Vibrio genomosp. F6]|uniref:Rho-binding antiterminator n=1 Tax=Vibrio genomosp. F6 TaxID=723172 RepID=UPI0010BE0E83|nr:Rho-binding antiterminator [Vibrio genomosp. F6]TKF13531.1 transcriptional regulator [Vibrio genomosp. F6]